MSVKGYLASNGSQPQAQLIAAYQVMNAQGKILRDNGLKNYVAEPHDNSFGNWVSSNASLVTVGTTTTAANLPSASFGSALVITRVSGTTGYVYTRFTYDQADLNKMMSQVWDQIYAGSAGDYQIQLWSNTASNYRGTSTQISLEYTNVPVATGTLQPNAFTSPTSAAPYMELRIVAVSGTTPLYINNVTNTPGQLIQGATIGDWQSYTPTLGGMTLNASSLYWRRVGSDMEVQGYIDLSAVSASTASMTLPLGLNVDTTVISPTLKNSVGYALKSTNAGGINLFGAAAVSLIVATTSPNLILFTYLNATDASGNVTSTAVSGNDPFSATTQFTVYLKVPIAEWKGNGTTNLAPGAQLQMFSSSTGTWDAAAAAGNTVGGLSPISGALTATRTKVVRLPYAPQSISDVKIIFVPSGYTAPVGQETWAPYVGTAAVNFGARVTALSGTDVTVSFYQYKTQGSTFNSTTGAVDWASADGQWGIVVANPSSPVGFQYPTQYSSSTLTYVGTMVDGTYTLVLNSAFQATITSATTICTSGTATATFKINGVSLGGTANSVSSSQQTQNHSSANIVGIGQTLTVVISSASALVNPVFTVAYTRIV